MYKITQFVSWLSVWIAMFVLPVMPAAHASPLTDAEKQWLLAWGPVKLCVDPSWMPYERLDAQGQHEGIAADLYRVMQERLGVELELYPTASWSETLQAARERRCDMISMARDTPERRVYLDFTEPFVSFPFGIATTSDKRFIEHISQITDQQFVAPRDFAIIQILRRRYPKIQILEVDTIEQGLDMVRHNQAYGYIDSTLTIGYTIQKYSWLDLKISGQLELRSSPSIATRNDQPILKDIFQKGLDVISEQEQRAIYNRWVAIRYDEGFDYELLIRITLLISMLLLMMLYWNRRLRLANRVVHTALQELGEAKRQLEQQNLLLEQQNHQLEQASMTDALTQLYNRARLDRLLATELSQCSRYQRPLGVILMDIDHFKLINDNCGHQAGDQALVAVAQLLKREQRLLDSTGRWGGEEFLIICPATELRALKTQAEHLRQALARHHFALPGDHQLAGDYRLSGAGGQVTASFGIALMRPHESAHQLVSRADQALYAAKKNGRNRVEVAAGKDVNRLTATSQSD
ncbi:MAG: diguanylate cyclase [Marinobacterium sp.]|nr:diguanylate cyclase [Marinobacterium sp.]